MKNDHSIEQLHSIGSFNIESFTHNSGSVTQEFKEEIKKIMQQTSIAAEKNIELVETL